MEDGQAVLNGCAVSVRDDESILEMDGSIGCITRHIHLMSRDCTLRNGSNSKFDVRCILP